MEALKLHLEMQKFLFGDAIKKAIHPEIIGLEEDALEGDANAISLLECKYNIEGDF